MFVICGGVNRNNSKSKKIPGSYSLASIRTYPNPQFWPVKSPLYSNNNVFKLIL